MTGNEERGGEWQAAKVNVNPLFTRLLPKVKSRSSSSSSSSTTTITTTPSTTTTTIATTTTTSTTSFSNTSGIVLHL